MCGDLCQAVIEVQTDKSLLREVYSDQSWTLASKMQAVIQAKEKAAKIIGESQKT